MEPAVLLPKLLLTAWLLPLVSFTALIFFGKRMGKHGIYSAYVATGAIVISCVLSMIALFGVWLPNFDISPQDHASHDAQHSQQHEEKPAEKHASSQALPATTTTSTVGSPKVGSPVVRPPTTVFTLVTNEHPAEHTPADSAEHSSHEETSAAHEPNRHGAAYQAISGDWYILAQFDSLILSIGYHIDALTIAMFCMVTLIASCVHFYAIGYMHDELHDFTDPQVTLKNGEKLTRRGRYSRFFQYLSLFCFSMLGIVVAGNIAMTFVFWELVGICSYFLIGFYIERNSASTAANKAFIVNRIGDFGMLIGLMALWATVGTFNYGDQIDANGVTQPGLFSQLRTEVNAYHLVPTDGMVAAEARAEISAASIAHFKNGGTHQGLDASLQPVIDKLRTNKENNYGYWLLCVAGVGIFCGCMGKSAQFPLHVWLPDAMEGPTPVSALVHSATMVAAGVYLTGRFFPVFTPEALLVIACVGAITLFMAATIAITATDIKRVLAYSTVSQLGYMMLSLGLGGWVAGLFHLITHACFKSLLFMGSGSVIHAVHTNEMTEMGGLRKKMPITAYTMLAGCLAIIGAGIPLTIYGFSGYYSKDSIIEQAWSFGQHNAGNGWIFTALQWLPILGATITAFYMFRMWYMTFCGTPRDQKRYDHAHESPWTMAGPLVLTAALAVSVGWGIPFTDVSLSNILEAARPIGTTDTATGQLMPELVIPMESLSHQWDVKKPAGLWAFGAAMTGLLLATMIYLWKIISADMLRQIFKPIHVFLVNKWYFDELYEILFIKPTKLIAGLIAGIDKYVIDGILHTTASLGKGVAGLVASVGDRLIIDNSVDSLAKRTMGLGQSLRGFQSGRLRYYIMSIAGATVVLFILVSLLR